MIVTFLGWLGLATLLGAAIAYFDKIIDWAKKQLEKLENAIKKVWVYLQRVPGAVKEFIRYIKDGVFVEKEIPETEVPWEEVVAMHERGEIDDATFEQLRENRHKTKIAEVDRER